MKRFISVLLCMLLVGSMCACGGKKEDADMEVVTTTQANDADNQDESDVNENASESEEDISTASDSPSLEDLGEESEEAPKIEPGSAEDAVSKASLTWHAPKGSKKLVVEVSADFGAIRVLKKGKKAKTISICNIPEGMIMDVDHVMDTLKFEDFNGDGYDDLYVEDLQDDNPMHHVFFWNADTKKFEIEAGA